MPRTTIALAIGLFALAQTAWSPEAGAQTQKKVPTPVVAIVDIQLVMQNSEAAKGIRTQIEKVRTSYQQTVHGKEEELRKLDQDLEQQRSILAPDAYQQRQRDFQQKVADAQKDVQDRRQKLETAFGKAMQQVQDAVVQIVDQIAKEQAITLVLPKASVIHSADDMDITQEVLKRLNSRLPSVSVAIPK
jgi:outer membrane protein